MDQDTNDAIFVFMLGVGFGLTAIFLANRYIFGIG